MTVNFDFREREREREKKETMIALKIPFLGGGGDVVWRKLTKKLLHSHNIYMQKNIIFFPIILAGK